MVRKDAEDEEDEKIPVSRVHTKKGYGVVKEREMERSVKGKSAKEMAGFNGVCGGKAKDQTQNVKRLRG